MLTDQTPDQSITGITSYGQLKDAVVDAIVAELEPIQRRHDELLADPAELQRILAIGANKARAVSEPTLQSAKVAMGVTL